MLCSRGLVISCTHTHNRGAFNRKRYLNFHLCNDYWSVHGALAEQSPLLLSPEFQLIFHLISLQLQIPELPWICGQALVFSRSSALPSSMEFCVFGDVGRKVTEDVEEVPGMRQERKCSGKKS